MVEKREIREIPKGQRYVGRPSLEEMFKTVRNRKTLRNRKIAEAVKKYGYSQVEIADYLNLHYSAVSRSVKDITGKQS